MNNTVIEAELPADLAAQARLFVVADRTRQLTSDNQDCSGHGVHFIGTTDLTHRIHRPARNDYRPPAAQAENHAGLVQ
jgi:hypothetical protein